MIDLIYIKKYHKVIIYTKREILLSQVFRTANINNNNENLDSVNNLTCWSKAHRNNITHRLSKDVTILCLK